MCEARYAAFDGEGARVFGGRWNHPGTPVVYASGTLALAALEIFVHLDVPESAANLVAVPADIPASVSVAEVRTSELPTRWREYRAPEALADIGVTWAQAGRTAVLAVPSAVIPPESNYLLNPAHPSFSKIRIGTAERFSFDPRMWK
jgi:RES domain-containing protein